MKSKIILVKCNHDTLKKTIEPLILGFFWRISYEPLSILIIFAYYIYFNNHHNGIIETSLLACNQDIHIYFFFIFLYETLHFMKWLTLHSLPTHKDITMSLQGSLTSVRYLFCRCFLFCWPLWFLAHTLSWFQGSHVSNAI